MKNLSDVFPSVYYISDCIKNWAYFKTIKKKKKEREIFVLLKKELAAHCECIKKKTTGQTDRGNSSTTIKW